MPTALLDALRVQADAERARRARGHFERVSALQPYVDEELADWQRRFGEDDRMLPHATTLAMLEILERVGNGPVDGDAVIEALAAGDRLDAGEPFNEPAWERWATAVTTPPPKKTRPKRSDTPFDYAARSATEMYLAFDLTNGYSTRAGSDPFKDPRSQLLLGTAWGELQRMIDRGASFERDRHAILLDWLSRPRTLPPAYRPGGNWRAPRAFLARAFRFELDDERRLVGQHAVRPAWLRDMQRRGWLGKDEALTEVVIDRLRDRARANLTHAPPAGFVNSAMLRERLLERQDDAVLAQALLSVWSAGEPPDGELLEQLELSGRVDEIVAWLEQPASRRAPHPVGAVSEGMALSPRSVDTLIDKYEASRTAPFRRAGRSRLVPVGELDRIVEFANSQVGGSRRRKAAEPST